MDKDEQTRAINKRRKPRGRLPAGKKGEGKAPRIQQVMGSNPWKVVTPKMGNPGGNFGLVGSSKGGWTPKALSKKRRTNGKKMEARRYIKSFYVFHTGPIKFVVCILYTLQSCFLY